MESSTKKKIMIASIIGFVILFAYVVVLITYKTPAQEATIINYPSGFLTDSVFDYQNMNRNEVDIFKQTHNFEYLPVSAKIPEGLSALSGGAKFVLYKERYLMLSEYDGAANPDASYNMLCEQITKIIKSDAEPAKTVITELNTETGYINGCYGMCHTMQIDVEGVEVPYYAAIFELCICENYIDSTSEILVGCISSGSSIEYFDDRYNYAGAIVDTFEINKEMLDAMKRGQ